MGLACTQITNPRQAEYILICSLHQTFLVQEGQWMFIRLAGLYCYIFWSKRIASDSLSFFLSLFLCSFLDEYFG